VSDVIVHLKADGRRYLAAFLNISISILSVVKAEYKHTMKQLNNISCPYSNCMTRLCWQVHWQVHYNMPVQAPSSVHI